MQVPASLGKSPPPLQIRGHHASSERSRAVGTYLQPPATRGGPSLKPQRRSLQLLGPRRKRSAGRQNGLPAPAAPPTSARLGGPRPSASDPSLPGGGARGGSSSGVGRVEGPGPGLTFLPCRGLRADSVPCCGRREGSLPVKPTRNEMAGFGLLYFFFCSLHF